MERRQWNFLLCGIEAIYRAENLLAEQIANFDAFVNVYSGDKFFWLPAGAPLYGRYAKNRLLIVWHEGRKNNE